MKQLWLTILMIYVWGNGLAQLAPQKVLTAPRIDETIRIDAVLDEAIWQNASPVGSFTQLEPAPGQPSRQEVSVRIAYDDKALYIGAELFDSAPDSIMRQFTERDQIGVVDYFGLLIDAYQDGQNGLGVFVTASGVQVDIKYSAAASGGGGGLAILRGDRNWDAVWDSQTRITDRGWVVELKIPYSALRFPNVEEQRWNLNFARMIRRYREQSFWNEVKPEEAGLLRQSGELVGIREIFSPVRLSATPFVAAYAENYYDRNENPRSSWVRSISGGMDIKYGINDAFTLDVTLIPDFGEARSDNQVLNLSPFEVRFDENRPFFTEGIELFNKGNLFYSRRIGGRPLRAGEVEDQLATELDANGEEVVLEEIVSNPQITQLINASKVSGRTVKGLGLGVFNATAAQTNALIRNLETGAEREWQASPLTNYNVLVLDQNLKYNSFVTLINTNVMRSGATYDANVTGLTFDLKNRANSYSLSGKGALSQLYHPDSLVLGHEASLSFGKTSGQFNYRLGYNEESDRYDRNDLGLIFANNERLIWGNAEYNIFQPFGPFNYANFEVYAEYSRLYFPNQFSRTGVNLSANAQTRDFINFGVFAYFQPVAEFDYFEPRREDFSRYYRLPTFSNWGGYISTDYRKRLAIDVSANYGCVQQEGRAFVGLRVSPRFRATDKLFLRLQLRASWDFRDEGYVNDWEYEQDGQPRSEIIFGQRDVQRLISQVNVNYNFTNNMTISFRLNHNWTSVAYERFGTLGEDGALYPTDYGAFHDTNFNAFNIDTIYRWRFAPGSDLFFIWKNSILESAEIERIGYGKNFDRLLELPQTNSFSLKAVYYLDYLNIVQGS